MEKITCNELLDLVAQREGMLLAEGDSPGEALITAWLEQLSPLQLDMLSRYDARVDSYKATAHERVRAGAGLGVSLRLQ